MIYIGICDDVYEDRLRIKTLCDKYFLEKQQEYCCKMFSKGSEIINYEGEKLLLLFLDIEMQDISGIEVMHRIIDSDKIWRIVFVSSHKECVFDTFGLKTLDFGIKPVQYGQISQWLNVAVWESGENKVIQFEKCNANSCFALESIKMLSADGNYIKVEVGNQIYTYTGNLKSWEKQLEGTCMLRVHRSYIVNMNYIDKIVDQGLMMTDKKIVPIGRKYNAITKKVYNKYIMNKIRGRI